MAATIVRDDAEAVLREEKHLAVPSVGAQRPPVRERYDRAFAPVLVVDLGAILGFNCAHVSAPFDDGFGESAWFLFSCGGKRVSPDWCISAAPKCVAATGTLAGA